MDAPSSDTEVECPPCIDSGTWRSAHLGYACSDYRIGGASEGYCEDVGSISTAPDAPNLEGTALQHCPRACGACPPCVPVDKELSPGLVWACVISMIAFFGLPVYKYCIDGYRWTKQYLAMWRAAEKQKMDSIKQRNTVRKAGGLFKRGLLPKGSRRRLGAVAPAGPGAAEDAAAGACQRCPPRSPLRSADRLLAAPFSVHQLFACHQGSSRQAPMVVNGICMLSQASQQVR